MTTKAEETTTSSTPASIFAKFCYVWLLVYQPLLILLMFEVKRYYYDEERDYDMWSFLFNSLGLAEYINSIEIIMSLGALVMLITGLYLIFSKFFGKGRSDTRGIEIAWLLIGVLCSVACFASFWGLYIINGENYKPPPGTPQFIHISIALILDLLIYIGIQKLTRREQSTDSTVQSS